jgi:hypothetical protein
VTDLITLAITLPINGTPLERAQALIAAMGANPGLGAYALGQLLGDLRPYIETGSIDLPRAEIRFYGR